MNLGQTTAQQAAGQAGLQAQSPALHAAVQRSRRLLHRRALVAAAASAVPVPGLDWAMDAALLSRLLPQINAQFGLTPEQLDQLTPHQREQVQKAVALVQAATSGSSKFFLGTDSAPHPAHLKEHATGCAGCYTAHAAIEMYAEAFDNAGALDQLEGFASFHGPDFYSLPRNTGTITLRRESWTPPDSFAFGEAELKPLRAGEALPWRLV